MKIFKYVIEAIFVYFLFLIIKILGLNLGRYLSSKIFLSIGLLFRPKKLIEKNISYVFGQNNNSEKIIKSMLSNYGKVFAEYIFLKKFRTNKFKRPHIEISGNEILEDIVKKNKQAVFISGHFANFELMAMELEKHKINLAAIYRPLNNFFLNPFMVYLRKNYICKNQIKKGLRGTAEAVRYMKNNCSLALMVDQRLGQSERYAFFNKPAHTTTLPAQLAIRFNCEIVPIYLERKQDDLFKMEIMKPIEVNKQNDTEKEKKAITLKINSIVEKMILKNPGQWIWTHNRWK